MLTAGKPMQTGDSVLDEELKRFQETWVHKLRARLVELSTRGKQVVVENSSHDDGGDMALVAVRVIREIVRDTHR